jgi:uncharacterized membrane protein (DUF4010 family)
MYELLPDAAIWRLSVALAIGLLIGLERGWQAREAAEGERAAGVRTHALAGLLGGVWGVICAPFDGLGAIALALAFATIVAVVAFFRLREIAHEHSYGATTVFAAMLAFSLGALAALDHIMPAIAAGVATTGLLAAKNALHVWLRKLSWPELRSGLILLVMSFILLPVLPDRAIDPWGAVNPFVLWLMTVLIALISFIGYVAVRLVGYERGIPAAGLAGGLASSTATTAALARLATLYPDRVVTLAGGATLANAVMAARVLVILFAANPALAARLAPPLLAITLVYAIAGAALSRRAADPEDTPFPADGGAQLENPLDLPVVLKFGALLAGVMALSRLAARLAGESGVYIVALFSGLADVDAIALAMARHSESGIGQSAAAAAILIAVASNTVTKAIMGGFIGGGAMGWRLAAASMLAVLAGAATYWGAASGFPA